MRTLLRNKNTMEPAMFHPQAQQNDRDPVAAFLLTLSRNILVWTIGLIPIIFLPIAFAPFNYSKALFVLIGVLAAVVIYVLSILRDGEAAIRVPLGLMFLWLVFGAFGATTLLAGDLFDSFLGSAFNVHTTGFVALVALTATAMTILRGAKKATIRLALILAGSTLVLALFHTIRFIFGADVLTAGIFTSATSSLLGSWNDLAVFFGLTALLSLVSFALLADHTLSRILAGVVFVFSLIVLAVVNITFVWVILATGAFITLVYNLASKHFYYQQESGIGSTHSTLALTVCSLAMLVVSGVFLFDAYNPMGEFDDSQGRIASWVAEKTGTQTISVKPSFEATLDIMRGVYEEQPIFGLGPNRFADGWRLYKDQSINQTVFWDTRFESGSGFIPTAFVTTGLLGGVAIVLFIVVTMVQGLMMLARLRNVDALWRFMAVASVVGTAYLWVVFFFFTPNVAVLLLAGAMTGLLFAVRATVSETRALYLSVAANRIYGFAFVGIVVVVIFGSIGSLYAVGQHYGGIYTFNRVLAEVSEDASVGTIQADIMRAYRQSQNDEFMRQIAQLRLSQITALSVEGESPDFDQEEFQRAVSEGITAAQRATQADPTEPANWIVLGRIYSVLAGGGVEGAEERAIESFENAREHAPQNPAVPLFEAQLASRVNDFERARAKADESIALKRNYTEALYFLTQIDIVQGQVDTAIARTRAIISLEPNNPARYYQLGVLLSSTNNPTGAIGAYERAIALDPNYANARYLLAILYAENGQTEAALEQLRVVARLNPDNQSVRALITQLEQGGSIPQAVSSPTLETEEAVLEDGADVSRSLSETELVTPVTNVSDGGTEESANE